MSHGPSFCKVSLGSNLSRPQGAGSDINNVLLAKDNDLPPVESEFLEVRQVELAPKSLELFVLQNQVLPVPELALLR